MPATSDSKKRLIFNSLGVILEFAFWIFVLLFTFALATLIGLVRKLL